MRFKAGDIVELNATGRAAYHSEPQPSYGIVTGESFCSDYAGEQYRLVLIKWFDEAGQELPPITGQEWAAFLQLSPLNLLR